MFQRRIRKASAQARPVRMSGVALTSVSRQDADAAERRVDDVHVGRDRVAADDRDDQRRDRRARRRPRRSSAPATASAGWPAAARGGSSSASPPAAAASPAASSPPVMSRPIRSMSASGGLERPDDPALVHDVDAIRQRRGSRRAPRRSAGSRRPRHGAPAAAGGPSRSRRRRGPASAGRRRAGPGSVSISRARISRWRLPPDSSRASRVDRRRRDRVALAQSSSAMLARAPRRRRASRGRSAARGSAS